MADAGVHGSPANHGRRAVLYLHGGGFTMGSCNSHRALAARVGLASRARVLLPEYRLAPEHPFPVGLHDAIAAYEAMLQAGHRADEIIIAGDSAGGGLTVATALGAIERGLPAPRALVLLSPWTDLSLSGESIRTRAAVDPWLSPELSAPIASLYLNGVDPRHPAASPLWADLSALPPTLVQVGDHEILLSDSLRLAERANEAGAHVEVEVGEELWHVWHLMAPALPQANAAFERIGEFVEAQFAPRPALRECG